MNTKKKEKKIVVNRFRFQTIRRHRTIRMYLPIFTTLQQQLKDFRNKSFFL